jgi:hypothetical protein
VNIFFNILQVENQLFILMIELKLIRNHVYSYIEKTVNQQLLRRI